MENSELIKIFEEIADLLLIQGENPFKIRAYQNAARAIEGLSEPLSAIHARGELETIDGIGKAIAQKIAEALTEGHMSFYDNLKASMPDGILDLLRVPGMGPKKAKLVYDQLHISNIEELKSAAQQGKLRDLPGMGQKTEEKILRGIENLEQFSGRFLLGLAYPIAQQIMERITKIPGVYTTEIGGSLRRGKETIGDADILVSAQDAEPVIAAFLENPRIKEIRAKGTTKASVLLDDGLQVDLRVVAKDSFGAALQYFTGSKEHNVKLREFAVKKGLKVNEYGVFRTDTNEKLAGETEEEVYRAIGFPYIAPELREGQDELELALEGKLPVLIEKKDILCALHNHTTASDGSLTLEQLVEEAQRRGYKYLAVTDHSRGLGIANGLDEDRLMEQIERIHAYNRKNKNFRVLTGAEVDIRADGSLDYPDTALQKLDIVIASIHSALDQTEDKMTKRVCDALLNPYVDFLAHPTGRLMGQRPPIRLDMEKVFAAAKETGAALEINSYYARLDLNDKHIREAKRYGVRFCIETDTHVLEHFDNLILGIKTARRARLEAGDVLNTLDLHELGKQKRNKKKF